MSQRAILRVAAAALLLALLPLVAAHGDEHMDMGNVQMAQPETHDYGSARSYWSLPEYGTLMSWHIALEILAWIVVLPVGKLSDSKSQECS
jgi:hypothetical protein